MTDTDTADLVRRLRTKAGMLRMGEPITFGSDADALDDAADTIERLTRERDQADAAAEAHEAKWQAFCKAPVDPDGAGTCACSYDQPGDVCLFHSPKLAAAEDPAIVRERRARMRQSAAKRAEAVARRMAWRNAEVETRV